ncbi:SGNH/GDSL hydrolase family protein [Halopseudomonas pachastrellae]|nr:SGNH/GDSL hydrolase family protein [Halopseudomonas pachastrellae]
MGLKFVDVRAAFAGKEAQYIISDGIHPTAAGSRVLADKILQALIDVSGGPVTGHDMSCP